MKKLLLLLIPVLFVGKLIGQVTCMPDTTVADSIIISPFPFNADLNPDGGITDTACIDAPFDFVFTVNVPANFNLAGTPIPITSVEFAVEGALTYDPPLPDFDYVCNPPDCIFPGNSSGCLIIFGTTNNVNDIGVHATFFEGLVRLAVGIDIPITFPDPDSPIPNFPQGDYLLHVKAEGSENCDGPSSTRDRLSGFFSIKNQPNPFSGITQIEIFSAINGEYEFQVHDILGKTFHKEKVRISEGLNTISFDGSSLANGLYIYSLSDGKASISDKMILNRR